MSLFGSKKNSILGIDIGTSSIKLVELVKNKESYNLLNYGFVENIQRDIHGTAREDVEFISANIKAVREKTKFTTNVTVAALPTYTVFTSIINLPQMNKDELAAAVRWEAKKIIPLPLEDIVLDYQILNEQKTSSKLFGKKEETKKENLKILIIGASKDVIKRYTDIAKQSGLVLSSLETEAFALSRSLIGDDPAEIMIVEAGAMTTDIIIVQNGIPFLTRSIEVGGYSLTRAIMNSLNINEKRAEQLKRDIGLVSFDEGEKETGIPKILKNTLEPVIHEIKYTMDLYRNHVSSGLSTPVDGATGNIEKIILTGGSSMLPNLSGYLSEVLGIRVIVGDPWSRVVYPDDLRPVLGGIGCKFSVAIGLGLK